MMVDETRSRAGKQLLIARTEIENEENFRIVCGDDAAVRLRPGIAFARRRTAADGREAQPFQSALQHHARRDAIGVTVVKDKNPRFS